MKYELLVGRGGGHSHVFEGIFASLLDVYKNSGPHSRASEEAPYSFF